MRHTAAIKPRTRLKRLRNFLVSATLLRYPVSVARERVGVAILALLVAGFGLYTYSTRDEAIKRRAIEFILKAAPGGIEVNVDRAAFEMFGGITLYNVSLAVPFDERLDPSARDFASRRIFGARSLTLRHNPWMLLFGKLRVERVVAVQPTIFLRHNIETGLRNWQLLTTQPRVREQDRKPHRPIITLRQARAAVSAVGAAGEISSRVERLDADVRPHPQSESGYFIEVRRYSEPVERTTVYFDPGEKIVANTPFVDAQTIRLQLPQTAQRLFDMIGLRGEARVSRLLYGSDDEERLNSEINLRRGRCDIPLRILDKDWLAPTGTAPVVDDPLMDESLVRMDDVRGFVKLIGERVILDLNGFINKAPCRLHGEMMTTEGDIKTFGVDVRFEASGLPMPEGPIRQRMLMEDSQTPGPLKEFLEDYDPHGKLDAYLHFTRQPNAQGTLRIDGYIRTLGMRGSAIWFPYPLDDVNGIIRFAGKDFYIENLNGRHGSGHANINAHINVSTRYTHVDLDIKATTIPIDMQLYDALPKRYQAVLDRFRPRGMAHVHARLFRPGTPEDQPRPEWTQRLTIDLIDATADVPPHPRPLENVNGRLEVEGDRIRIMGLTGDSDVASMRFDGYALIRDDREIEMEVRVEAGGIQVDDEYVAGLPAALRERLAAFQPRGTIDILGRVSQHDGAKDLTWELDARVRDATICHREFPYQLDDVTATLSIGENRLSVADATARRGDAVLSAAAEIVHDESSSETTIEFELDARDILLDDELLRALPAGLKDVWSQFSPRGQMKLKTALRARQGERQEPILHRTEITLVDAEIRFRGFPLPLTHVNGQIVASPRRVEILDLYAKSGDADIRITGDIQLDGDDLAGTLRIDAKQLNFNRTLTSALPAGMRRFFESIRASGPFDLRLASLRFESTDTGSTQWHFDGAMTLNGAAADLGFKIENAVGTLSVTGAISPDGRLHLDARTALSRATMAGWHIEDLTCRFHTDASGRFILVEDATAQMYGGLATGFAEIELGERRSHYQASFTARDMQLGSYLDLHRPKADATADSEQTATARGDVSGNLVLRGRTGRGGYIEGTGELYIRQAQVWKLPIMLAIFQLLNLTVDENIFHDGMTKFYLANDQLIFHKIDLQGSAVTFIGGGELDLRTDRLDITLLAGSPVRVKIPLLTEMLQTASREIMEVRVMGTIAKPEIALQPLRSLGRALRTLFPEPPPSRRD